MQELNLLKLLNWKKNSLKDNSTDIVSEELDQHKKV